ncbi:MAG: TraB/GumN family protein [Deltaproteobacteria bacterium]|jgi:pheromone shutdown-related protein TraB|nr:TraB/GumN family protein [Deltaproteobacteria bacterium]MBT4525084.1 TraB/GumN family protein [Deltaproteobacteria bacterium]
MREEFILNNKKIILVGTAHISQDSIDEVTQIIREEKPDTVCVELCQSRYDSIHNANRWKNMDIIKVIKQGKTPVLLANLMMSAFQKKMGDKLGVKPGTEMVKALEIAKEVGASTVLADRDVTITLKRTWGKLSLWEKMKLFGQLFFGIFESPDISEEDIEKLKEKDMLTEAIETLSKALPSVKTVLVDERDLYLSTKIAEAKGETIVAVVGAAHTPGIKKNIDSPVDLSELEILPKPKKTGKILKWLIPLAMLAVIIYGFLGVDMKVGLEMVKYWVLINGVLAAVGAILVGAHIITIISAFVAAPITSLNPTIAAGWVAGLTEAWVRKPKVEDFENLAHDITSIKGFRKNKVTKILLVVVFCNLGSAIGTFIGIPWVASLL